MSERYTAYSYAYPHKTAYRPLDPPRPLREVWANESRDALFLYFHVPFCEMRCGFCNLFTTANPADDLETRYVDALERQARATAEAIAPARFARMAIGGGTPTFLSQRNLERLFAIARERFGVVAIPTSVETSPKTAEPAKLRILREHGVDRISIGVQSFVDAEVHAAGRSQERASVERALERIREAGFPTLNIDLMYGLPGQTEASWLASLEAALRFAPEELYIYPLYVRPLTGLAKLNQSDARESLYDIARDFLIAQGYEQRSMRMFALDRRGRLSSTGYCCQSDGMIGLGCGARSYTRALHYSFEWAVGRGSVRAIIDDYIARERFDVADYGFALDDGEQRRRWLIQSLLLADGVDRKLYRERFSSEVLEDFPELRGDGRVAAVNGTVKLTEEGLAWSDALGPMLYSDRVKELMGSYELR